MPTHDYECAQCGAQRWDVYQPLLSSPPPSCECGGGMERLWTTSRHKPTQTYPYVTTHITGKPVEVRDSGHERELMKKHNVRRRDDAAFLEDRYELVKGRAVHREGRGVGMPGSWV